MNSLKMFPQVFISLQEELLLHPDLLDLMRNCPEIDFPTRLGFLAGLLEVVVDGYYHYGEIEELARILIIRMQERRVSIVIPFENKQVLIAGSDAIEAVDNTKLVKQGDSNDKINFH